MMRLADGQNEELCKVEAKAGQAMELNYFLYGFDDDIRGFRVPCALQGGDKGCVRILWKLGIVFWT